MLFRITFTDAKGACRDLTYRLNDLPLTKLWIAQTRIALGDGHHSAGFHVLMRREPEEVAALLAELRATAEQAVGEGVLPPELLDLDFSERPALNALHAALHLNETEVPPVMNRLNCLVHMMEGSQGHGDISASFYLCGLDGLKVAPLPEGSECEFHDPEACGDLLLGYGTVGKRLRDCFWDGDLDVVRNGLVRPQTTLVPEVTVVFGVYGDQRWKTEAFERWCAENAEPYGYQWRGTMHGTLFQPTLGRIADPISLEEVRCLMVAARHVVGVALLDG